MMGRLQLCGIQIGGKRAGGPGRLWVQIRFKIQVIRQMAEVRGTLDSLVYTVISM